MFWFQGKVKSIYENMKNLLDPTPRFDSHISKNASKVTSVNSFRALELTQVNTHTHTHTHAGKQLGAQKSLTETISEYTDYILEIITHDYTKMILMQWYITFYL